MHDDDDDCLAVSLTGDEDMEHGTTKQDELEEEEDDFNDRIENKIIENDARHSKRRKVVPV